MCKQPLYIKVSFVNSTLVTSNYEQTLLCAFIVRSLENNFYGG